MQLALELRLRELVFRSGELLGSFNTPVSTCGVNSTRNNALRNFAKFVNMNCNYTHVKLSNPKCRLKHKNNEFQFAVVEFELNLNFVIDKKLRLNFSEISFKAPFRPCSKICLCRAAENAAFEKAPVSTKPSLRETWTLKMTYRIFYWVSLACLLLFYFILNFGVEN